MPLGGLITIAILLPNLLYLFMQPTAVPPPLDRNNLLSKIMERIERIGQFGSFLIPFFYQLPPLRNASVDALLVMAFALMFYYSGWLRYALKGHRFALLFAPFLGVPLPMAVSPVVYFAAAAVLLHSWPLAFAVLLLAAGHLFISQGEWQRCRIGKNPAAVLSR